MDQKDPLIKAMGKLIKFADHKDRCRVFNTHNTVDNPRECDCGYQAALIVYYEAVKDIAHEFGLEVPAVPLELQRKS